MRSLVVVTLKIFLEAAEVLIGIACLVLVSMLLGMQEAERQSQAELKKAIEMLRSEDLTIKPKDVLEANRREFQAIRKELEALKSGQTE